MPDLSHRYRRPIAGFSLIELMVVTMVISLLAIMALPTMNAYFERARVTRGISVGRTVQASLASFTTDSQGNQYPAAIDSYGELIAVINANGGQLKDTEAETGVEFQQYTPLDLDQDGTWDSYTLSFKVIRVSPQRPGWCITIQPSGVERCAPQ
jgi:prepilin-type N-terminal cleavage/methylation domain-containing protein